MKVSKICMRCKNYKSHGEPDYAGGCLRDGREIYYDNSCSKWTVNDEFKKYLEINKVRIDPQQINNNNIANWDTAWDELEQELSILALK